MTGETVVYKAHRLPRLTTPVKYIISLGFPSYPLQPLETLASAKYLILLAFFAGRSVLRLGLLFYRG